MKKCKLSLHKTYDDAWQSALTNNHGRKIYLKIAKMDNDNVHILQCFYVDRSWRPSPLKQTTQYCKTTELLYVLSKEVDKNFCEIVFDDSKEMLTTAEYIDCWLQNKKKFKFLVLVDDGYTLRTRLKNRTHRVIYLEITRNVNAAVVSYCNYCDRLYKNDKIDVVPSGLRTINFDYSLDATLKFVNDELNCDFTDVIITSDTFGFDKTNLPICGSI